MSKRVYKLIFPVLACALPDNTFVDGLLGMDFLKNCGAVIDVNRAEISISLNRSGFYRTRRFTFGLPR
jgi:hypothetical protein